MSCSPKLPHVYLKHEDPWHSQPMRIQGFSRTMAQWLSCKHALRANFLTFLYTLYSYSKLLRSKILFSSANRSNYFLEFHWSWTPPWESAVWMTLGWTIYIHPHSSGSFLTWPRASTPDRTWFRVWGYSRSAATKAVFRRSESGVAARAFAMSKRGMLFLLFLSMLLFQDS